eukprot:gene28160-34004_t
MNSTIKRTLRLILPLSALRDSSPPRNLDASTCIRTSSAPDSHPSYRCLPSFFIIGAMKSGTGELLKWLSLHPLLRSAHAPHKREGGFFSRISLQASIEAYLPHLPSFSKDQVSSLYTFEKSPAYLRNATALRILSKVLPSARIIVILRKPAERSLSEFLHHSRHRRYRYARGYGDSAEEHIVNLRYLRYRNISFLDTRANNTIHLSASTKTGPALPYPPLVTDVVHYFRQAGQEREEIANSRYPRQLRALWDSFPPSQVLILLQEELLRDTLATLRKIEAFLGLPCFDFSSVSEMTAGRVTRRDPSSSLSIKGLKATMARWASAAGLSGLVAPRRLGGRELLAVTPQSFQREMNDKFKEDVVELRKMLKDLPQSLLPIPPTPLEVLDNWV